MPRPGPRSTLLSAITQGALALPGLSAVAGRASAESAPLEVRADYRFSRYSEDNIDSSKVANLGKGAGAGSTNRYEIDVHQFRFEAPISDRYSVDAEIGYETMSGATPWYIQPRPGEDPLQVMTGATIDEARTDVLLKGSRYLDRGVASVSGGVSTENDYLSVNLGVSGERQYNEKNTTLSAGLGGSYDMIDPTGGGTQQRPKHETRHNVNVFAGLSQILGRSAVVQSSLKYQYDGGFLSDPYKWAYVEDGPLADARPDARHRFSWLTRYRQHFESVDGTLHFDYTLYYDDWDVNAHTFELAWYQTFFDRFRLIPSARYYSQSQAYFYAPFYDVPRGDGLRSSDYRLSPFGAYSWKIRAETRFQTWSLLWDASISYERYESAGDLAFGKVSVENPGLVSYELWSVGLTARF